MLPDPMPRIIQNSERQFLRRLNWTQRSKQVQMVLQYRQRQNIEPLGIGNFAYEQQQSNRRVDRQYVPDW